ncbi:hypothetical protein JCM10212_000851 [Sporobolomyces blumeae]
MSSSSTPRPLARPILYDLVPDSSHLDRPGPSFSPFCLRARLALERKRVEYDHRFVSYHDLRFGPLKDELDLDHVTAPILRKSDGQLLMDSTAIALYLDEAYPDRPNLFLPEAPEPVDLGCPEYAVAVERFESVLKEVANRPSPNEIGSRDDDDKSKDGKSLEKKEEPVRLALREKRGPFWTAVFFLYAKRICSLFDPETKAYWIDDARLGDGSWNAILNLDEAECIREIHKGCKRLSDAFLSDSKLFFTSASQPGMTDFVLFGTVQLIRSVSPRLFLKCFVDPSRRSSTHEATLETRQSTREGEGEGEGGDNGGGREIQEEEEEEVLGNFARWVARMDEWFPLKEVRERDAKSEVEECVE